MKQSEQLIKAIGTGAATIYECSNTPRHRIPRLRIMLPGEVGRVINAGHSDQAVHNFPAESIELSGDCVASLYQLLCEYYSESAAASKTPDSLPTAERLLFQLVRDGEIPKFSGASWDEIQEKFRSDAPP